MRTQYQEGRRIKILYTSIVLSGALIDTHFGTRKFKDHLTKESKHCFTRIRHFLSTTKLENDSMLGERVALALG